MKIDASDIPPHILAILERLTGAGYSAQVVGGAVRDILLGQKPKDFDVITSAHPPQVRKLFRRCFLVGRRFRLALVHTHRPHHQVTEVATYRDHNDTEDENAVRYEENGRMLRDNAYGTLDTDAHRRDFTINALYYDPLKDRLIDKVDGLADIDDKLVRMIGDDTRRRLREDPLRAVRAVRIAEHNRIGVEPGLAALLPDARPWLADIPRARIGLELSKIFASARAMDILAGLSRYRLLDALVPGCIDDTFIPGRAGAMHRLLAATHTYVCRDNDSEAGATAPEVSGQGETAVEACAVFPVHQSEEIRYAAFYLPLFLRHCPDSIASFDSALEAIAQVNPHILCPTVRAHRRGMLAIWRTLPRLFRLKPGQMRRFSEHRNFPATWFLYRLAVQNGVWERDNTTEAWENFVADRHGQAYLRRVQASNTQPAQSAEHAERRYTEGNRNRRRGRRGGRSRNRGSEGRTSLAR